VVENLLMVSGLVGVFISGILYMIWYGRLRHHLKKADSTGFYKLGIDAGTELFGPSHCTKEAQAFISKKLYMKHPDRVIVELGKKMYGSKIFFGASMLLTIAGMLFNAVTGS
jgi:hypothetical protein